jgi:hypothetical protein
VFDHGSQALVWIGRAMTRRFTSALPHAHVVTAAGGRTLTDQGAPQRHAEPPASAHTQEPISAKRSRRDHPPNDRVAGCPRSQVIGCARCRVTRDDYGRLLARRVRSRQRPANGTVGYWNCPNASEFLAWASESIHREPCPLVDAS